MIYGQNENFKKFNKLGWFIEKKASLLNPPLLCTNLSQDIKQREREFSGKEHSIIRTLQEQIDESNTVSVLLKKMIKSEKENREKMRADLSDLYSALCKDLENDEEDENLEIKPRKLNVTGEEIPRTRRIDTNAGIDNSKLNEDHEKDKREREDISEDDLVPSMNDDKESSSLEDDRQKKKRRNNKRTRKELLEDK